MTKRVRTPEEIEYCIRKELIDIQSLPDDEKPPWSLEEHAMRMRKEFQEHPEWDWGKISLVVHNDIGLKEGERNLFR